MVLMAGGLAPQQQQASARATSGPPRPKSGRTSSARKRRSRGGFEGEDAIGDIGEGVGEESNICTDVDGNTAARHQLDKNRELGLTRAGLLRDTLPVKNRWRYQHREPFSQ